MRDHPPEQALPAGSAVCIGAFDGLHRGHQALFSRAGQALLDGGAPPSAVVCLLSFDPHPAVLLAPQACPPRLQSTAQMRRVARGLGIARVCLLPFDRALASTPAPDFVDRFLLKGLSPTVVVVGEDFRFGAERGGSAQSLAEQLRAAGREVHVVSEQRAQDDQGVPVKLGSSRIRQQVRDADFGGAAAALGRAYAVEGPVRQGEQRGRSLGFPTANIELEMGPPPLALPGHGVYYGRLRSAEGEWAAVANLGVNPSFDGIRQPRLEVHALDAPAGLSLYGERVEFFFGGRVREERRFNAVDELREAIQEDISFARARILEDMPPCDPKLLETLRGRGEPTT